MVQEEKSISEKLEDLIGCCPGNEMVMSELLSGMLVCCAWTGREFTSELMTQVRVVGGTSSVPDYYILQLSCCTLQALPFWYSC